VEWSLNNSLEMLGIDFVDCFLIHWPFAAEKTADNKVKLGPDGKVRLQISVVRCLQPDDD
jgi:diketogulonate reductase-like aldo/keto reductase